MRLRSMAWPGSGPRRVTRRSSVSNSEERSREKAIDGENSNSSAEDVRRNRPNVRRYVRKSTEKRDWAVGDIHERFLRAIDQLGGQNKATPKKILQLMEYKPEGLTLGQVKSHLQMHRKPAKEHSGLSEESTPRSDQGQLQSQSHRIQPQRTSATGLELGQPKSGLDFIAENPLVEGAAALLQLKEGSGRSAEAAREEVLRCSPSEHIESMQTEKMDTPEIFSVARDEDYLQRRANMEHEFCHQHPGSSSNRQTGQPLPGFGSFLGETSTSLSSSTPVDVTKSLSSCMWKAEEGIELELTMATKSRGPRFQFSSPTTQEEAALDLALA